MCVMRGRFFSGESGPCLHIKTILPCMGISMLNIRWSWDHLIFNMGILILVKWQFYIDVGPWILFWQKHTPFPLCHFLYWQNLKMICLGSLALLGSSWRLILVFQNQFRQYVPRTLLIAHSMVRFVVATMQWLFPHSIFSKSPQKRHPLLTRQDVIWGVFCEIRGCFCSVAVIAVLYVISQYIGAYLNVVTVIYLMVWQLYQYCNEVSL